MPTIYEPRYGKTPDEINRMKQDAEKGWRKRIEGAADLVAKSFSSADYLRRNPFLQVRFAYLWLLKGDGRAAIFLTYCLFWSEKSRNLEYGSFYKSFPDIYKELAFPKQGVMTATRTIQRLLPGVLEVDLVAQPGREHLVTAYTVHYDVFMEILKKAAGGTWKHPARVKINTPGEAFEQWAKESYPDEGNRE